MAGGVAGRSRSVADHLPMRSGDARRHHRGARAAVSRAADRALAGSQPRDADRRRAGEPGPDQAADPRLHGRLPGQALSRAGGADPGRGGGRCAAGRAAGGLPRAGAAAAAGRHRRLERDGGDAGRLGDLDGHPGPVGALRRHRHRARVRTAGRRERTPVSAGAAVVVIGGGVTGLSAAWWLARAGVDVQVLEKGLVGWEASGRNGGGASHYHSPLFHEEQRLWPLMDDLLGYPTEYRRERVIFALNEQHLADYRNMAAEGRKLGYRVSDLDPKQVRELVPLASEKTIGGVHLHYGGHANPQRTVQAYAWALQDLGGRIQQHTRVEGIVVESGRVVAVETAAGRIGADALVVAAGPQTGMLLAKVGVRLPLGYGRAEMIVTEPAPLMPIGGADGNGLYGRQTLRGNLAFGGGPHEWIEMGEAGPPGRPTSPVTRSLARRVAELMPGAARLRVIRSWAGTFENTPDGRPVLDRLDEPANLVVATMSSVGFGLSPASGHAVADLVLEGRCSFADIDKLKLERFANTPEDWLERRGWLPPAAA